MDHTNQRWMEQLVLSKNSAGQILKSALRSKFVLLIEIQADIIKVKGGVPDGSKDGKCSGPCGA